ncbi:hypothetical protein [Streptomyces sp. CA-106131]|uniref:hypothetical protein n=1 Tax=Streptomyces sp. CA-106131 TaxID=3240045 RepID=UPI003D925C0E
MADTALAESGAVQRRLRKLPARVGVRLLLAASQTDRRAGFHAGAEGHRHRAVAYPCPPRRAPAAHPVARPNQPLVFGLGRDEQMPVTRARRAADHCPPVEPWNWVKRIRFRSRHHRLAEPAPDRPQ